MASTLRSSDLVVMNSSGFSSPCLANHELNLGTSGFANTVLPLLQTSAHTVTGGTITFTKRAEAVTTGEVSYAIQESDDLGVTDAWQTMTPTSNTISAISFLLPAGSARKFARLMVKTVP